MGVLIGVLTRGAAAVLLVAVWLADALAQNRGEVGEIVELTMGQRLMAMSPMFLIVFMIFYLLVILPQKKQLKLHEQLLSSLKKGEQVVTSGGLIGRVASVEKDHLLLEVAANVKIRVLADHVKERFVKEKAAGTSSGATAQREKGQQEKTAQQGNKKG